MKVLPYFLFVIFLNVVYSSFNYRDDYQDFQNEYPNDVDYPSILHKYEFNDLSMTFNPTGEHYEADNKEDNSIDYETFEESSRDFERGIPNWLFQSNEEASSEGDNVCNTKVCHKVAKDILSNIDASIDPCDDFEKFACGGWRKRNPIPKSNADWSIFTKLWKDEKDILRDLIERQANSSLDSSGSLIYNWYSSCMDKEGINTRGPFPLLKLIAKLGSCPLINPFWFPFGWTFVDRLILLNRLAINPFFSVLPAGDLLNSSRVLIHVKPSKLVMSSIRFYVQSGEYYTVVRRAYIKMMMAVMKKLSLFSRRTFLYFQNEIRNVYILELLLAKARLSTKVSTYHEMTLKQLQWEIPEFSWRTYILKLYHNIPQKKPITGNEIISISNLMVLRKIAKIIRLTPKSTLANYLIWNVAFKFSGDLSPEFYAISHKFFVAKYGEHKRKERWQECVVSTSSALDMAVGKLFVEEKFSEDSKQKAGKIAEDIRQQLIKDFETITWMDTKTTKNAKEKANVMVKNIGYPKFILNETKVRAYYKGMSFDPKDFLFNKLQRRILLSNNSLSSREEKPDRASWSMAPQVINAYYSINYNKIVILAGVLQAPFWQAGYPMSMQYGGIGFIIGHEMTHGFDNQGMLYDKHGNYHSWSSNASSTAFKTKSHCLQDQYSKYKIFGENINGKLTLGENIADNAGIKLAFKAYQKWLKTNGPDKTLPDLPFNSKQLFFLKSAQMWCSNIRKKSTLSSLGGDEHPPKIFRVIGPFSNFNEFSKAYNCSSKSKMNPPKKCFVW